MQKFQDLIRLNFAQKFQGYRMIGTLAVKAVKDFFEILPPPAHLVVEEELLTGYVRYQTLFLKTRNQALKIQIFKQKKILIQSINSHLHKLGYHQEITDIRLK